MQFFFRRIVFTSITIDDSKDIAKPYPSPIIWDCKRLFFISYGRQSLRLLDFLFLDHLFFGGIYFIKEILCRTIFIQCGRQFSSKCIIQQRGFARFMGIADGLLLCCAQFVGDFLQELHGVLQARDGAFGALDGVGQVFVVDDGVVLDEAEVEAVVFGGDLFARKALPALVGDALAVVRLIRLDEVGEVLFAQRMRLAEGRHIRAQVVEPDFFGIAMVRLAAREEEHVRLDALRVEDARRQAQDGVQVALLHEVAADGLTVAVGE